MEFELDQNFKLDNDHGEIDFAIAVSHYNLPIDEDTLKDYMDIVFLQRGKRGGEGTDQPASVRKTTLESSTCSPEQLQNFHSGGLGVLVDLPLQTMLQYNYQCLNDTKDLEFSGRGPD